MFISVDMMFSLSELDINISILNMRLILNIKFDITDFHILMLNSNLNFSELFRITE